MKQKLLIIILSLMLVVGASGITPDTADAHQRYSGYWTQTYGHVDGSWFCDYAGHGNYFYYFYRRYYSYWWVSNWRPYSGYYWQYDHRHLRYREKVGTLVHCSHYWAA